MESMKKQISCLSKDKYTIKAKSCQTITFMGARPNYFKITNGGNSALYLGVSMSPTEDYFDEKINPASTKLCVDAYGSEEVYILNPSEFDANIIITSFSAPFDASAVAMSGFGQDFSNIELNGEVDARGDLKEILSNLNNRLSGTNNLGKVAPDTEFKNLFFNSDGDNCLSNISSYTSQILKALKDDANAEHLQNIYNALNGFKSQVSTSNADFDGYLNNIIEKMGKPIISKTYLHLFKDSEMFDEYYGYWSIIDEKYLTELSEMNVNYDATAGYYFGEIINFKGNEKVYIHINNNHLESYDIETYNKICHTLRPKKIEFQYEGYFQMLQYPDTNTVTNYTPVEKISSKKIVALNLKNSEVLTCDLSDLGLSGYRINKILGVNNSDIQSKVFIRQFIVKENGVQDNAYSLTIDMWNELYEGKGATFFDVKCEVDPASSQIIVEVVK